MALLIALVVQYALGITVNLGSGPPPPKTGAGSGQGVATALSQGAPALIAHVALGMVLLFGAIAFLVLAARSRRTPLIIAAIVGLICIWVAFFTGGTFVSNGDDNTSLAMALQAAAAILSYLFGLYASTTTRTD